MRQHLGHRQLAVHKGPLEGGHAQVRDVFQAVGCRPLSLDPIPNVLAMRPGFHQAGRGKRTRTHGRAIPRQAVFGVMGQQGVHQRGVQTAPMRQQRGAVQMRIALAGNGADVFTGIQAFGQGQGRLVEAGLVSGRLQTGFIKVAKVRDFIPGAPTVKRRGLLPLVRRERVAQRSECLVFIPQVLANALHAFPQMPSCRAARSFMISSEPPPIIITLTSR